MTVRQPFTRLCQMLARPRLAGRVDLHLHTTASDGAYTSAQVVDLARRSGLAALAITDHDTLEGVEPARLAAGNALEVIPGVEITCRHHDRELHLLAYFIAAENEPLQSALRRLRLGRTERFQEMVERLRVCGITVSALTQETPHQPESLGRRHLAELMVKSGRAATVREAFNCYLSDRGRVNVPKMGLPVAEAIALVRQAGGVAAWAHPPYDCLRERAAELRDLGLAALEAEYPAFPNRRVRQIRQWAGELGLAVTGGSDCHGPEPTHRAVGACGISLDELNLLRDRIGR